MKTLLYNAKVYVERDHFEEAVLIEDGIIKKVGSDCKLLPLADATTQKIDCEKKTLLPGMNDSHLHFMQFGETLNQVDIDGVPSITEMIKRGQDFMKAYPKRVAKGMHAIGWNQDLFVDNKRLPNRYDLDQISTEIPIVLERVCGHIVTSNSKAIEILGLTKDSKPYQDGEFLTDENGEPNGIFTGNACNIVKSIIPDFTMEERKEILVETMQYGVSHGLTSVQSNDVGTTFMDQEAAFKMFCDVYDKGEGLLRYRHQVCFNDLDGFRDCMAKGNYKIPGQDKDSWLQIGALKLFKDGSLGARTALMTNGYVGEPDNHGLEWIKQDEMEEYCKIARDYGLSVITHAIGDEAIRRTIDCYEKAFIDGKNKLRLGVNHCQITDQELIERMAKEDIFVYAQPIFLDYDMTIVEDLCGKELASTSYAWHSLKEKGVHVAYGTDCPVEDCNPFPNIYMAVTRKNRKGEPAGGFYPAECVDVETAIDAYTYESAYAEFMEDKKGRIKEGFYADMILLDQDIFTINPDDIKDILPVMTMVGGKIVFEK